MLFIIFPKLGDIHVYNYIDATPTFIEMTLNKDFYKSIFYDPNIPNAIFTVTSNKINVHEISLNLV